MNFTWFTIKCSNIHQIIILTIHQWYCSCYLISQIKYLFCLQVLLEQYWKSHKMFLLPTMLRQLCIFMMLFGHSTFQWLWQVGLVIFGDLISHNLYFLLSVYQLDFYQDRLWFKTEIHILIWMICKLNCPYISKVFH